MKKTKHWAGSSLCLANKKYYGKKEQLRNIFKGPGYQISMPFQFQIFDAISMASDVYNCLASLGSRLEKA